MEKSTVPPVVGRFLVNNDDKKEQGLGTKPELAWKVQNQLKHDYFANSASTFIHSLIAFLSDKSASFFSIPSLTSGEISTVQ